MCNRKTVSVANRFWCMCAVSEIHNTVWCGWRPILTGQTMLFVFGAGLRHMWPLNLVLSSVSLTQKPVHSRTFGVLYKRWRDSQLASVIENALQQGGRINPPWLQREELANQQFPADYCECDYVCVGPCSTVKVWYPEFAFIQFGNTTPEADPGGGEKDNFI